MLSRIDVFLHREDMFDAFICVLAAPPYGYLGSVAEDARKNDHCKPLFRSVEQAHTEYICVVQRPFDIHLRSQAVGESYMTYVLVQVNNDKTCGRLMVAVELSRV